MRICAHFQHARWEGILPLLAVDLWFIHALNGAQLHL